MRIILTQNGSIQINEMKKEINIKPRNKRNLLSERSNSMFSIRKNEDNQNLDNIFYNIPNLKMIEIKKDLEKKLKRNNAKIFYNFINKIQGNNNENKLNLYLSKKQKEQNNLNTLNLINKKQLNKSVSIRDIINKNAYNSILNNIEYNNEIKNKNFGINDYKLRTQRCESKENKLNKLLEKKINVKENELINYLKGKKEINYYFVEKLSQMNDNKLEKLNKICGQNNKENEKKKFYKLNSENLIDKKRKNFEQTIKGVDNDLNKIQKILNKFQVQKVLKDYNLQIFLKQKFNSLFKLKPINHKINKIKNKNCSF